MVSMVQTELLLAAFRSRFLGTQGTFLRGKGDAVGMLEYGHLPGPH